MAQQFRDDRPPAPAEGAPPAPPTADGRGRGRRLRDPGDGRSLRLAWVGAILLLALTVALQAGLIGASEPVQPAPASAEPPPPGAVATLQARYLVGANRLLAGAAAAEQAEQASQPERIELADDESASAAGDQSTAPDRAAAAGDLAPAALLGELDAASGGRTADRLRTAMLIGEVVGSKAALARLDELRDELADQDVADLPPDWLTRDMRSLRALYSGGGADALAEQTRAELVDRHGWFGELALSFGADADDAQRRRVLAQATRASLAIASAGVLATVGFIAGVILLIIAGLMWSRGRLVGAYRPPAPGGSAHLETFALFLLAFLALSALGVGLDALTGLSLSPLLMWVILPVSAWPLLRGAPAQAWRFAIGWHRGKGVFREMGAGVAGYLAGLPILALGLALTLVLMGVWAQVAGPGEGGDGPAHPVAGEALGADLWTIASIYLLGVVWAPIVEETFFRGSLYHHLRGRLSPVAAALLTGLAFAFVHPQGLLAVPAIAALGFNFALIRQWRGSIIAPATAHALSNFVVLSMLFVALA